MANLSNINNKFIVTDGGNVLIGQTSAVGSSIFQVTGSVTITGGTTSGLNITTSGTQDTININRAANNDNAITKYQTASADKWIVGLRNTSDDNFRFYSYGTSTDVLTINQGNGSATFAGNQVTVDPASGDAILQLQSSTQTLRIDQNSIRTGTNNNLALFTNGNSNQLVLKQSNGCVGIGTASPGSKLEIVTAVGADAIRMNYGQSADIFLGFNSVNPRILLQDNANIVTHNFQSNGDNYIVGSNVGIGTTLPSQQLELGGIASPALKFTSTGTNGGVIIFNVAGVDKGFFGSGYHLGTGSSNDTAMRGESDLVFLSGGNNQRMRIGSSGNVTLAITNATSSTTIGKDGGGMWMETAGSTNALSDMRFQARASGAGSYSAIRIKPSNQTLEFQTSGAVRMRILNNGNISIPNGSIEMNPSGGQGIYLGSNNGSNLLDYYEEGTWTPGLTDGSGNQVTSGTYTRIGRSITISGLIIFNSQTSSTQFTITTFPFTVNSADGARGGISVSYSTSSTFMTILMDNSSTNARVWGQGATGNPTLASLSGKRIYFGGTYQMN